MRPEFIFNYSAMTNRSGYDSEAVGSLLRQKRLALGLAQDHIAYQAGIEQSTLSQIERGRPTDVTTVIKIATALKIDPAEIWALLPMTRTSTTE